MRPVLPEVLVPPRHKFAYRCWHRIYTILGRSPGHLTRHCCNMAKLIHAHHLLLQLEIFWSHIVCQITSCVFNTLILVIKYC